MLKQYPMLRYVLQKAFWYLLTFVVAVAINFTLPRMGENNPVDIIMGKAAQGLSPEQAKLKKETLLKAFGMAELDDQGNVIYDPEVDENGQVKMVKVPKKENGAVVLKTVKVTDAEGNPVMEERQKLDEQGNPVFEEKPVLDEKGKPVMEKDPKTKKKVAKVEQVAVMEQFQVERQDTVMIDTVLRKTDPRLASGISQFFVYIKNVFKGDLGLSYSQYPKPVTEIIKESLPWTLAIQAPTIILGWIVGNLLGAFAAYKRGIFDKVFFPCAMFLNGVPFFVFGMLLVALFSITLGWFPAMGAYSPDIPELTFTWNNIKSVGYYYVLPFFSVFPILLSGQATGMRSMSIYELGTDYMKYAKWLGLREGKIISYVFRNAMLPQLTGLAQSLGAMVGGALITEMIFSYPGLGMAMLTAIQQNDYATIQGCTLMISTCVLVANFAVDVLIAIFDPRVKAGLQMGGK
ncbi:ABC transporter permease [Fibrobacter sp. UWR2]|uniref:ABC transporter permease n=1 Tax=Fibrobacter sp. UWR2 TaxID=1964352 RepID=UPI000B5211BE|nr:ABC transporter permease [Fibrobacter sp. UWR2]OWV01680.1 ABC transporter permease [Fibrobacter sp. UWR2]